MGLERHPASFRGKTGNEPLHRMISLLLIVGFLSLAPLASAGFPVTASNVNNGTVMPQPPAWPFPQFLEYGYGRSLASVNPDGVPHAEMEATVIRTYVESMRRLEVIAGWKPAGLPNRLRFIGAPTCSEGAGYALIMAALMADKDTFDGLWVEIHSQMPGVVSYATGAVQTPDNSNVTCKENNLMGWTWDASADGALDGDEDIALALLIAWRQWGVNSGYNQFNGQPIDYQQEFVNLTRAMATWHPNAGDPGGYYDAAYVGIDGYVKSSNTNGELTTWANTAHAPAYPQLSGYCTTQGVGTCTGEACLSYLAPGYYRAFSSVHESLGNTHLASQWSRAAASSEYIIERLNAQRPPYSVGSNGYTVNDDGSVVFQDFWGANGEGIRTPLRNGLTYLWYGNPADRWDPLNHAVTVGTNQAEQDFCNNLSSLLFDPRVAGNAAYNANYGLTFWGFAQWRVGNAWTQAGLMPGSWHLPWGTGPMAVAAAGASSMAVTQQYELLMNLYRQLVLVWDTSSDSGVQTGAPAYFQTFFRTVPLAAITGNFANPASMTSQPNMKVYCSVDRTVAHAGDTLTYVLSYRNYGSADANPVSIRDVLDTDLMYITSSPAATSAPAVGSTGTVAWNRGTVTGRRGDNLSSTLGAVTLVVRVNPASPNKRICNPANVYVGSTLHWTSNEYPNEVSMTFRRNCVDIAPNPLSISKSADPTSAVPGGAVTYRLTVGNQPTGSWVDGGRPKVYAGFGAVTTAYSMQIYSQLRSEAYEPLINPADYRWSFYFYDPTYGVPGGAITQQAYLLDANHNPNTYGNNSGRTLADLLVPPLPDTIGCSDSMTVLPVLPGSDASGRWNQRYVFRWFDTPVTNSNFIYGSLAGIPSLWYTQTYGGNTGLNMQYGDLNSNTPQGVFDVMVTGDMSRPATLWANGGADRAWSWMGAAGAPDGSMPNYFPKPVSPDWTRGDGTSVPVTFYDPYATQGNSTQYTRVLVEEWDGYVWRRIFGNGPLSGLDLDDVVVTDTLDANLVWGGFISPPAGSTTDFTGNTATWNLGTMSPGAAYTLTYWASVNGGASNGTVIPNHGTVHSGLEQRVSNDAPVTVAGGGTVTPTATPTTTPTLTPTPTSCDLNSTAPDIYMAPSSLTLGATSPCPGDLVTLAFNVCNDNQFYTPPGRVILSVEDPILQPCVDGYADGLVPLGPLDAGTWLLTGFAGALDPPATTWDIAVVDGGWPLGGVAYTGPACASPHPVSIQVRIPSDLEVGKTYRIQLSLTNDYQGARDLTARRYTLLFTTCSVLSTVTPTPTPTQSPTPSDTPTVVSSTTPSASGTPYGVVYPCGNVNSGNPARPWGQHLKPAYGAAALPDGVTDQDMDRVMRELYCVWLRSMPRYTGETIGGIPLIAPERNIDNPGNVVSEGVGYAMLIAASYADKPLFDGLATYFWFRMRKAANGCAGTYNDDLASWSMGGANYATVLGCDSASDADEDIAMGLLMACRQWPGSTTPNYCGMAQAVIEDMLSYEDPNPDGSPTPWYRDINRWLHVKRSDTDMINGLNTIVEADYIAPGYYRCWGQYYNGVSMGTLNGSDWTTAADNSVQDITWAEAHAGNHGFPADLLTWTGMSSVSPPTDAQYGGSSASLYEGGRGPWRWAMDALYNGNAPMRTHVQHTIASLKAGGPDAVKGALPPWSIEMQWNTNGTYATGGTAPGVGFGIEAAVSTADTDLAWINEVFRAASVYQLEPGSGADPYQPDTVRYFNMDLRMLGLLMLTGDLPWPCSSEWGQADLKVSLSVDKTFGCPGDTLTYTVSYRNAGSATASSAAVRDTLPANLTYVSSDPAASSLGGAVYEWSLGSIAPGASGTLTLVAVINLGTSVPATLSNSADAFTASGTGSRSTIWPDEDSLRYRTNLVDVVSCGLTASKSADPMMVNAGAAVTYRIAYSNVSTERLGRTRPGVFVQYRNQNLPSDPSSSSSFKADLRIFNESYENIDLGDYRVSYFLNDTGVGPGTGVDWSYAIDQQIKAAGVTIANRPVVPGSDALGTWNQRIVMGFIPVTVLNRYLYQQWEGDGGQILLETTWMRGPGGSAGAGDMSDDWSYPGAIGNYLHIKTVNTNPGGYADPNNQSGSSCVTNLLVEEWDGSVWRAVAGNAPRYGRDMADVTVTDQYDTNMTFGGFIGAPVSVTPEHDAGMRTLTWDIAELAPGETGTLTYWMTVDGGAANGTVIPNLCRIRADKEKEQVSNNAPITVGMVTATPTITGTINTPTETPTTTFTPTPTWTVVVSTTDTPMWTLTATITYTRTPTDTFTPTPTWTAAGSFTDTPTWTFTDTSIPPTNTATPTPTATRTVTSSPTGTPTLPASPTSSATRTATPSPTASATGTVSPTAVPTGSVTPPTLAPTPHPTCGHGQTRIYPSPCKCKKMHVVNNLSKSGRVDIRVFNAVGELGLRTSNRCGSGVRTTDLDVGSFAPGVYFYMADIHYDSGGSESLGPVRFVVIR